mgnify:CR=1 FL=1
MSTEDLKKLIGELKGEHVMEWESIDQCVEILEKIKDTEDDEEIKVIKKVVIFIKKTYDSGRETYILPEELEYLNDLYLQEEVNDDSAGDLTDTGTPKKVVEKKGEKKEKPLTEEQKKQLKIEEMLKGNDDYKKIADEIKKAEKNLNTEITRRKTHIAKLKIKAKDKANMIFGDLYAKGNLK